MTKLTVWALPHTKWRHYMEIITRNEKILYIGIDVHSYTGLYIGTAGNAWTLLSLAAAEKGENNLVNTIDYDFFK